MDISIRSVSATSAKKGNAGRQKFSKPKGEAGFSAYLASAATARAVAPKRDGFDEDQPRQNSRQPQSPATPPLHQQVRRVNMQITALLDRARQR